MPDHVEIKAKFSPDEVAAQETIWELLWVFYPRDENKEDHLAEFKNDKKSDEIATYLVDGLKSRGITVAKSAQ